MTGLSAQRDTTFARTAAAAAGTGRCVEGAAILGSRLHGCWA